MTAITQRQHRIAPLFAALVAILLAPAANAQLAGNSGQFLRVDEAFKPNAVLRDDGSIAVTWQIAEDYYLYRHGFDFKLAGGDATLGEATLPDGKKTTDEFFGETEIYRNSVTAELPLNSGQRPADGKIEVSYQGCADAGLCYPPKTVTLALAGGGSGAAAAGGGSDQSGGGAAQTPDAAVAAGAAATATQAGSSTLSEQDRIAGVLENAGLGWIVLSFLGLGILLAATPCVLPMVPILSGIIVGRGEGVGMLRGFSLSTAYVLAMAVAYTIFGVLAGLFGAGLQGLLQTPWLLVPFALVFVALSLSMFGYYELQLPSSLQNRLNAVGSGHQGSLAGAGIMGFVSALIVGPCLTAPLAGALIYIGTTGNGLLGGLALFALAIGMGLPLIVMGTLGGSLLPKAGAWMDQVKIFFGVILLGVAIWLLARILPGPIILLLWAVLLAGYAVQLGATEPLRAEAGGASRLAKAGGMLGLAYAAILLVGAASGAADPLRPLRPLTTATATAGGEATEVFERVRNSDELQAALDAAARAGRPALVDFYADWCVECVHMERTVFTDPKVRQALDEVAALQIDVTAQNRADRELMSSFNVFGPPTMLFFGAGGDEQSQHRLVGKVDAAGFVKHLNAAVSP